MMKALWPPSLRFLGENQLDLQLTKAPRPPAAVAGAGGGKVAQLPLWMFPPELAGPPAGKHATGAFCPVAVLSGGKSRGFEWGILLAFEVCEDPSKDEVVLP